MTVYVVLQPIPRGERHLQSLGEASHILLAFPTRELAEVWGRGQHTIMTLNVVEPKDTIAEEVEP
jgi:hypothetical protein